MKVTILVKSGEKEAFVESDGLPENLMDDLDNTLEMWIKPMLFKLRNTSFEVVTTPAKTFWRYIK